MRVLRFIVAAAILVIAAPATRAQEAVYPRTYTDQDCRDLDRQIDDSLRFASLDGGLAASFQMQRARADQACFSGEYAVGARQLRDILDGVIAASSRYRPAPLPSASGQAAAPAPGGPVTAFPPGSWREGCMDVAIDNGLLRADCVDHTGRHVPSALDLGSCRQPVSNQDGHLTCGEAQFGRSIAGPTTVGAPAAGGSTGTVMTSPSAPVVVSAPPAPPPPPVVLSAPPAPPPVALSAPPESAAPDSSAPGALPPGNWIASCRNSRMVGSILQSECKDRIGMWRLTAIDTRSCRQPIANRNGGLSCY
jgi:hypothetical protein